MPVGRSTNPANQRSREAVMTTFADLYRGNFNGDGGSLGDIVLFQDTGETAIWLMNRNVRTGAANLPNLGPTWHVKAAVDFDNTPFLQADLLWQNDDGRLALWQMQGTTILHQIDLPNPGSTWRVVRANEFDLNQAADILFQNDNSQLAIWLYASTPDGPGIIENGQIKVDQIPGPGWHAVATGDFNGDGRAGILFRHDAGSTAIWESSGKFIKTGVFNQQDNLQSVATSWHVVAAADFDGDGKADILWQNESGAAAIWLMDGTAVRIDGQCDIVGSAANGPTWHIVAARDMNGDLRADLLWQNDNGACALWADFTPESSLPFGPRNAAFTTQLNLDPQPNPGGHLDWHLF